MDFIQPIVTLLVGAGVIRELWAMRKELSELKGKLGEFHLSVSKELHDHSTRIRKLENK